MSATDAFSTGTDFCELNVAYHHTLKNKKRIKKYDRPSAIVNAGNTKQQQVVIYAIKRVCYHASD